MTDTEALLRDSPRCLLAVPAGGVAPTAAPWVVGLPFWWDGSGVWLTLDADSVTARALAERPGCALAVPSVPQDPEHPGIVAEATARRYGAHDPLGLVLHSVPVLAALVALSVKRALHTGSPELAVPDDTVVVRAVLGRLRGARVPQAGPGVAPALPAAIPTEVRRALAGDRRAMLAVHHQGRLRLVPAVVGPAFQLDLGPELDALTGPVPATLVMEAPAARGVGVALHGAFQEGRLQIEQATAWHGTSFQTVDVAVVPPGGIELPD